MKVFIINNKLRMVFQQTTSQTLSQLRSFLKQKIVQASFSDLNAYSLGTIKRAIEIHCSVNSCMSTESWWIKKITSNQRTNCNASTLSEFSSVLLVVINYQITSHTTNRWIVSLLNEFWDDCWELMNHQRHHLNGSTLYEYFCASYDLMNH